jgi:DNA-directed RNA polymerase subunit omega
VVISLEVINTPGTGTRIKGVQLSSRPGSWHHRHEETYMARITVEDCLNQVNNRFALIHLAAKRVRQLRKGAEPLVVSKNRDVVVALREIAAGRVFPMTREEVEALEQTRQQALADGSSQPVEETGPSEKETDEATRLEPNPDGN